MKYRNKNDSNHLPPCTWLSFFPRSFETENVVVSFFSYLFILILVSHHVEICIRTFFSQGHTAAKAAAANERKINHQLRTHTHASDLQTHKHTHTHTSHVRTPQEEKMVIISSVCQLLVTANVCRSLSLSLSLSLSI